MQMCNGEIDESHYVKHYWLADLKGACDRMFDVSIVNFKQQPKEIIDKVWGYMNTEWEYKGEWDMKKFASWCCSCVKRRRTSYSDYFKTTCMGRKDVPGPADLDAAAWRTLVDHWTTPTSQAVSDRLKATRGCVKDASRVGRGGVIAAQNRAVSLLLIRCWSVNIDC